MISENKHSLTMISILIYNVHFVINVDVYVRMVTLKPDVDFVINVDVYV